MTRPAFSLRAATTLCAFLLTFSLGLAAALAPPPARAQPAAEAAPPAQLDALEIATRKGVVVPPFSERTISSGEPVRAVLELNGGAAQRLGIAPGDRVSTSLFKR
ncbi:MAG: hypothetical protein B7Y75_04805 [Azorhizobium sp. 35-67-5]|nr:MAG: hypothetical protein B7Y75_04805 [Azorhizobium sp. 35-67-5]